MPKFEDKFVHFTWDESLKNKSCFVADSIPKLKSAFEDDSRKTITGYSDDENYPFLGNIKQVLLRLLRPEL